MQSSETMQYQIKLHSIHCVVLYLNETAGLLPKMFPMATCAEAYLAPRQTSLIEPFGENS